MTESDYLEVAKKILSSRIFDRFASEKINDAAKLANYNLNPFLVKYLASMAFGHADAHNIAKALIYPRILGTSISTSFGANVQSMVVDIVPDAIGSLVKGMDVEFVDKVDGRRKYCQLKAGPNTINRGDVQPILSAFESAYRLGNANNSNARLSDFCLGILYGSPQDLSAHYNQINEKFPVFIGADFWYRLTGYDEFYAKLIDESAKLALNYDAQLKLNKAVEALAKEIAHSKLL